MNSSFENIFEKFNLKREISKKRHRSPKTQSSTFHRKKLPILTKIEAGNSILCSPPNTRNILNFNSCCFNNHSKAKYNTPTRYNRLDIIGVDSVAKLQNYALKDSFLCSANVDIGDGKENDNNLSIPEKKMQLSNRKFCVEFGASYDFQTNTTLDSFRNVDNFKRNCLSDTLTPDGKYLETVDFDESNFPKSTKTDNTEAITTQSSQNCPTELDLLIDLIEQEEKTNKKAKFSTDNINGKLFNCDDRSLVTKPCLKGGYQEMFERALKHEKAKSNFLKYDKKIGLRVGQLLTVVKIETIHGLTLATVKGQVLEKNFAVVVAREMALRLSSGTQIEAFFDDKTIPYKLLYNGEYLDVYLEPYKLIGN